MNNNTRQSQSVRSTQPLGSIAATRNVLAKPEIPDSLPPAGIKVIDFTGVPAGPACCQMLAWFGADELKVERTGVGDITRCQVRDIATTIVAATAARHFREPNRGMK